MQFNSLRSLFPAIHDTTMYSCFSRIILKNAARRSLGICGAASSACFSTKTEGPVTDLDEPKSENDKVNHLFVNRNPRNLELMGIAKKKKGWLFQYPPVEFYHRLIFEKSRRYLTGYVEHSSGKVVVSASTKEYAIAKQLYSPVDSAAAENLGRVLAQRCLEAGITNMVEFSEETSEESGKYGVFVEAMKNSGIELTEPDEVVPDYEPGINYDDEFELGDLQRRQNLVRDSTSKVRKLNYLRRRKRINMTTYFEQQDPLYGQNIEKPVFNRSRWTKQ